MVLYYLIDRKKRILLSLCAIGIATLLNGIFSYLNEMANLPIFLDSVFTVMTAALFGLWPAVAVGLLSNSFLELLNGFPGYYVPFTVVNLSTALITALFVYKKKFETATHAFWLIIILATVNSLMGALIVTFVFGGYTNLSMDNMVRGIIVTGQSLYTSTFFVRIIVNIVDKGLSVLPSFFLYKKIQAYSISEK
ncbi:ECF transporter S component [Spirochaeta isovalerica]|uniref:Energy-coupling factor transport system substrate-specific component n=1 Tax=Spirochaeta isovalerica TaxID=150 RepID=A0A841R8U3_9SPIO|nr:ECF transporter S component [Spirochaeta isovalerica]MBB6481704.1 energy-coupling factor transport system substrate-specific component [Spirochaeta isovalerica]